MHKPRLPAPLHVPEAAGITHLLAFLTDTCAWPHIFILTTRAGRPAGRNRLCPGMSWQVGWVSGVVFKLFLGSSCLSSDSALYALLLLPSVHCRGSQRQVSVLAHDPSNLSTPASPHLLCPCPYLFLPTFFLGSTHILSLIPGPSRGRSPPDSVSGMETLAWFCHFRI